MRVSGTAKRLWRTLPNQLYVFNYHRIGDRNDTAYDPNVFSCSAEALDQHLRLIKERFKLLTLDELIELNDRDQPLDAPAALLTFDDGYIDGYTDALPVLKDHGASAIFFVTGDFIGSDTVPWWDRVAWWIRHSSNSRCELSELQLSLDLRDKRALPANIRSALNALKAKAEQLDVNLNRLEEALAPSAELPAAPKLFMGWEHLRKLTAAGMAIGSHTQTHRMLSTLTDKEIDTECSGSMRFLESNLNTPVRSLAYPVGTKGAFDARALSAAKAAGYSLAFTFIERANSVPITEPYALRRIGVDSDIDSMGLMMKVLESVHRPTLDLDERRL